MLDEDEFAEVAALYNAAVRQAKDSPIGNRRRLEPAEIIELYKPCLDAFERLTGYREANPHSIRHHRIAVYGLPCASCGKLLRTPQASRCVACGTERRT